VIYTSGCIEQGEVWVNQNLIPVAGVFVGLALVQVCIQLQPIYLTQWMYSRVYGTCSNGRRGLLLEVLRYYWITVFYSLWL